MCEKKKADGDKNNWDYKEVAENGYHAMLLQDAATRYPPDNSWEETQRLPVEGLDAPMRDEELFQLYGYVKYLMMAQFHGKPLPAVKEDVNDGDSSDHVPGFGAGTDRTSPAVGLPGPGGPAAGSSQWGGSSSSNQGGGPLPQARHDEILAPAGK